MKILLISDIENVLDKTLDIISEHNFCDFCVSLGNVSNECISKIKAATSCNCFCIAGKQDNYVDKKCQLFTVQNQGMCCISYSDQYAYWNEEHLENFQEIIGKNIEILFTRHSPKKHTDMYGVIDKPDYIRNLARIIKPKIIIHGHDKQNTIGTKKSYQQPDIKVIGIIGVVLLELNDKYQIKKFLAIQ